MIKTTAILVDGSFFLKRYRSIYRPTEDDAVEVANALWKQCSEHLKEGKSKESNDLYRVFYYDCLPFSKKQHNPLTGRSIDFSKTPQFIFRTQLLEELKKRRKFALRLGVLHDRKGWIISPSKTKALLKQEISTEDLTENDVYYDLIQKRVDIKIGLDIASLALKQQVNQIILISGDSDFVPAAKLARREGIDFILDPMWNPIQKHLFEHIDGLISKCKKPSPRNAS